MSQILGYKNAGTSNLSFGNSSYDAGEGKIFVGRVGTVSASSGNVFKVAKLGLSVKSNPGPSIRLALYAGSTLSGSTLIAEVQSTGAGTGLIEAAPAASEDIPNATNLWLAVKAAQATTGDYTSAPNGGQSCTSGMDVVVCECGGSPISDCNWVAFPKGFYGTTDADGDVAWSSTWDYGDGTTAFLLAACIWAEVEETSTASIEAEVSGTGSVSADLATAINLDADVAGDGSVSAIFGVELDADINGAGSVSADLETDIQLSGEVLGQGSVEAAPTYPDPIQISAAISGEGAVSGQLEVITPFLPAVRRYKAVLAADGFPDYEVPISSIELRLRASPQQCYINVTIPAALAHEEAISDRIDGTVTLYELLDDAETEILAGNIDAFRLYEGPRSASAQITAYKQVTWTSNRVREIPYATYRATEGAVIRYRFDPVLIYPGDTARVNGEDITVAEVYWSINPSRQTMEIRN